MEEIKEKWLPVKSFYRKGVSEDEYALKYEVSNFGRVRAGDFYPQQRAHVDGYRLVSLNIKGEVQREYLVHRLVAFAFLGKPPLPSTQVNHLDLNRANNRKENLVYCTHEENLTHSVVERLKSGGLYRKGYFAALTLAPEKMSELDRLEFFKGMEQGARYCKVNSDRKIKGIIKKVEKG